MVNNIPPAFNLYMAVSVLALTVRIGETLVYCFPYIPRYLSAVFKDVSAHGPEHETVP